MMKILDYIYTGLYRLLLKTGDKDIAEYSAFFFISIGLTLNFFVLLSLLNFAPQKCMSARTFGFIVFTLVSVANYFYFISKGRHKTLLEEAASKSAQEKKMNNIISVLFCVESIAAPVISSLIED